MFWLFDFLVLIVFAPVALVVDGLRSLRQRGSELVFRAMAARYIRWKTPEEALRYPQQTAAKMMNLGDWADVQTLARAVGDDYLRAVMRTVEAGQFNERSWAYWH